jgi:hypothetical protein
VEPDVRLSNDYNSSRRGVREYAINFGGP